MIGQSSESIGMSRPSSVPRSRPSKMPEPDITEEPGLSDETLDGSTFDVVPLPKLLAKRQMPTAIKTSNRVQIKLLANS